MFLRGCFVKKLEGLEDERKDDGSSRQAKGLPSAKAEAAEPQIISKLVQQRHRLCSSPIFGQRSFEQPELF